MSTIILFILDELLNITIIKVMENNSVLNKSNNKGLLRFFLLSAFNQLTIAAVSPYMQIIFRNKGYSYSLCGIIIAIGQAASIIVPLLISMLVNKSGRTKPFIISYVVLSILCFIPAILSNNLVVVIIFSFLANGFFWCNNPLTDGYISREIGGNSSKYGVIRAIGTLSYVLALIIFGVTKFPDEGNNKSILFSIVLCLLPILIVSFFLPEKKRVNTEEKKSKGFSFSWFKKSFYIYLGIVFLTRIAEGVVDKLLSSYMVEELNLGNNFSLFVALGAFFEFLVMIIFGRLLNRGKITPWFTLTLSSVALTLRLLLYLLPGIVPFAFAQTLHGLTFGALHVGTVAFINKSVDSQHYEVATTLYWSIGVNFAELLASFVGGFVIDKFGYHTLFLSYALFPFIALILCLLFKKKIISSEIQD